MKILLDSGIFFHSEFAEDAIQHRTVNWGGITQTVPVHGFVRKKPHENPEYQSQKDALSTIGRLIREGRIQAYSYSEIGFERVRGRPPVQRFNAVEGCQIHRCSTPVERSRFRQTIDLMETIAKGGKKDRKAGAASGMASQIPFFEWLCTLSSEQAGRIIQDAARKMRIKLRTARHVRTHRGFSGRKHGSASRGPG